MFTWFPFLTTRGFFSIQFFWWSQGDGVIVNDVVEKGGKARPQVESETKIRDLF